MSDIGNSGGYIRGNPDVSWWMTQIHKGITYRKKEAYQSQWADWRRYYRGEWDAGVLPPPRPKPKATLSGHSLDKEDRVMWPKLVPLSSPRMPAPAKFPESNESTHIPPNGVLC